MRQCNIRRKAQRFAKFIIDEKEKKKARERKKQGGSFQPSGQSKYAY